MLDSQHGKSAVATVWSGTAGLTEAGQDNQFNQALARSTKVVG